VNEHLGDRLSALLDGSLDAATAESARAHLAECPACAAELDTISAARALVRGLPVVDPPFGYFERMLSRRRRLPLGLGVLAAGAASVALVSMTAPTRSTSPPIAPLVQHHVVSASLVDDPLMQLTPVVVPTTVVVR
jgi:anti-sigma factor RsiW